MDKQQLIEQIRAKAIEASRTSEWYQSHRAFHLSDLYRVEHCTYLDAIELLENVTTQEDAERVIFDAEYNAHGYETFVQKGLNRLAEYLYIRHSTFFHVRALLSRCSWVACAELKPI